MKNEIQMLKEQIRRLHNENVCTVLFLRNYVLNK